jgi:SAM-dependent methyltransferase
MTDGATEPDAQDQWAQWILRGRDGDDTGVRRRGQAELAAYRDGVLDGAALVDGDVLLDVGTGDGLIGFGGLDRVGSRGRVILSDVSADLLAECRRRAAEGGVLERCQFVQAPADDLNAIPDGSVDAVTTRSVLIYVDRKQAALAEFFRVLRPGGRLSIFEPINSFAAGEASGGPFGFDLAPVADLMTKIRQVMASIPAERDPMLNFDERDLLRWTREAGFSAVELAYQAQAAVPRPLPTTDWEVLKRMAPNPLAPTYEQALAQALTEAERARFESHLRTLLASGTPARRTIATVYLRAVKP